MEKFKEKLVDVPVRKNELEVSGKNFPNLANTFSGMSVKIDDIIEKVFFKTPGQTGFGNSAFSAGLWCGGHIRGDYTSNRARAISTLGAEYYQAGCTVSALVYKGERAFFPKKIISVQANIEDFQVLDILEEGVFSYKSIYYGNNDSGYRDANQGLRKVHYELTGTLRKRVESLKRLFPSSMLTFEFSKETYEENFGMVPCGLFVPSAITDLTKYYNFKNFVDTRVCSGALDLGLCLLSLKLTVRNLVPAEIFSASEELLYIKAAVCPAIGTQIIYTGSDMFERISLNGLILELAEELDRRFFSFDGFLDADPIIQRLASSPTEFFDPSFHPEDRYNEWNTITYDNLEKIISTQANDWTLSKSQRVSTHAMKKEKNGKGHCSFLDFSLCNDLNWSPFQTRGLLYLPDMYTEIGAKIEVLGSGERLVQIYEHTEGDRYFPIIGFTEALAHEAAPHLEDALLSFSLLLEGKICQLGRVERIVLLETRIQKWELPVLREEKNGSNGLFGRSTKGRITREFLMPLLLFPNESASDDDRKEIAYANSLMITSWATMQHQLFGWGKPLALSRSSFSRKKIDSLLGIPIKLVEGCRVVRLCGEGNLIRVELSEELDLYNEENQKIFFLRLLSHSEVTPSTQFIIDKIGFEGDLNYSLIVTIQKLRRLRSTCTLLPYCRRPIPSTEGTSGKILQNASIETAPLSTEEYFGIDGYGTNRIEQLYRDAGNGFIEIAIPAVPDYLSLAFHDPLSESQCFIPRDKIAEREDQAILCFLFILSEDKGCKFLGKNYIKCRGVIHPDTVLSYYNKKLYSGRELVEKISTRLEEYGQSQFMFRSNKKAFRYQRPFGNTPKLILGEHEVGKLKLSKSNLTFSQINLHLLFDKKTLPLSMSRKEWGIFAYKAGDSYLRDDGSKSGSSDRSDQGHAIMTWMHQGGIKLRRLDGLAIDIRQKLRSLLIKRTYEILDLSEEEYLLSYGWTVKQLRSMFAEIDKKNQNPAILWNTEDEPGSPVFIHQDTPITLAKELIALSSDAVSGVIRPSPISDFLQIKMFDEMLQTDRVLTNSEKDLLLSHEFDSYAPISIQGRLTYIAYLESLSSRKIGKGVGRTPQWIIYYEQNGKWFTNPKKQVLEDCQRLKLAPPLFSVSQVSEQTFRGVLTLGKYQNTFVGLGKKGIETMCYGALVNQGNQLLKEVTITPIINWSRKPIRCYDAIRNSFKLLPGLVVGFDTEWDNSLNSSPTCIQIALADDLVFLWFKSSGACPLWIRELLEDNDIVKIGFGIVHDVTRLQLLNIHLKRTLDISNYQNELGKGSLSLDGMASIVLNVTKDPIKEKVRVENLFREGTNFNNSNEATLKYAAEDAIFALEIGRVLLKGSPIFETSPRVEVISETPPIIL